MTAPGGLQTGPGNAYSTYLGSRGRHRRAVPTPSNLQARLSKAAGHPLNVTPAVVGTREGAKASREVVGEFMELLGFNFKRK
jgi:hypothetical protein